MRIEIKSFLPNTYQKFTVDVNISDIVFDLKKLVFEKIEEKIPLEQIELFFFKNEKKTSRKSRSSL
jgi:hypothetical protein